MQTFYGVIEIEEPVLLELVESAPMQRLKSIHQYGISYYTTYPEEYTRYDHSIGVLALLRIKGLSLEEQIAGLLHDVSHTVFSHIGDYIFHPDKHQEVYQDDIHSWFLEESGIGSILEKYGFPVSVISNTENFLALEQPLPNLCADRIEYNLQGAYYQGFLTKKEILEIVQDLTFDGQKWISTKPMLMKKLVSFSLHMTRQCWGSPANFVVSSWFSEVIWRAIHLGILTEKEIHFGLDHEVWKKIRYVSDFYIQDLFKKIFNPHKYYDLVDSTKADLQPKMKFRGVDPWIKQGNTIMRLTQLDKELKKKYVLVGEKMSLGWPIKWKN